MNFASHKSHLVAILASLCLFLGIRLGAFADDCVNGCANFQCLNWDGFSSSEDPCFSADDSVCKLTWCDSVHGISCYIFGETCGGSIGGTNTYSCDNCDPECPSRDPSVASECSGCEPFGGTDRDHCTWGY